MANWTDGRGVMRGLWDSVTLTDGSARTINMIGAPLPATINIVPAAGDTITYSYSCDNGVTYTVKVAATSTWVDVLLSGVTHVMFQRTAGTGTTSTGSIS